MLAILLKLLVNGRVLAGLGGALILSLCALQTARLHHAKVDLARARAELKDPDSGRTWRVLADDRSNQIRNLDAAAARQDAALEGLRVASERATRAAAEALRQAHTLSDVAHRKADAVLAEKPGSDLCADADALIIRSTDQRGSP
jgi:hypothetical protein